MSPTDITLPTRRGHSDPFGITERARSDPASGG